MAYTVYCVQGFNFKLSSKCMVRGKINPNRVTFQLKIWMRVKCQFKSHYWPCVIISEGKLRFKEM